MRVEGLKVTVVGGAMGGATAALLLAEAGAEVRLIERIAQPRAVGAGIGLADNGFAVLSALGIGPALERASRVVGQPRIVDGKGRVLLAPRGEVPCVRMLRRSDLYERLLDAVARHPRIRASFGTEVLSADASGTVAVQEEDGARCRHVADLVIAADGAHSKLRAQGSFGATERSGITYARGLLPAGLALHEEAWTSEGLFGSFDVADGTYVYFSVAGRAVQRALAVRDVESLRRVWVRAYPACSELVNALEFDTLLVHRVHEVQCTKWSDGRVVLLGDAAHAMAPNLGQGGNSAIVDAAVLLDELVRHADLQTALVAYERRRKPAVSVVATLARRLGRLAELRQSWLRVLRDRLLLPIANHLTSEGSTARVLQEPPRLLADIVRRPLEAASAVDR